MIKTRSIQWKIRKETDTERMVSQRSLKKSPEPGPATYKVQKFELNSTHEYGKKFSFNKSKRLSFTSEYAKRNSSPGPLKYEISESIEKSLDKKRCVIHRPMRKF